eukprot:404597-Prymnesium_polylepis.1
MHMHQSLDRRTEVRRAPARAAVRAAGPCRTGVRRAGRRIERGCEIPAAQKGSSRGQRTWRRHGWPQQASAQQRGRAREVPPRRVRHVAKPINHSPPRRSVEAQQRRRGGRRGDASPDEGRAAAATFEMCFDVPHQSRAQLQRAPQPERRRHLRVLLPN